MEEENGSREEKSPFSQYLAITLTSSTTLRWTEVGLDKATLPRVNVGGGMGHNAPKSFGGWRSSLNSGGSR